VIIVLVLRSLSRSRSEIPSHHRRENEKEKEKITAPMINQNRPRVADQAKPAPPHPPSLLRKISAN